MPQTQRLVEAAKSNDIESLYGLLRENPSLLEDIDGIPFVDTPLHVAAASGSTHFAIEVLSLKPSFGQKLNPDGFSPMHVALLSGKSQTVRRLMDCDSELIRVKGKEGCTPLHYVAGVDDSKLLAQFLVANEKSINDLTIRKESAVHVAVKSGNLNAFKVLLKWIKYTENINILNWKDENGNGALHIAVATNNYEMVRLLIPLVQLNVLNQDGLTALDIAKGFPNNVAHAKKIEKRLGSAGAKTSVQLPQSQIGSLAQYISNKQSYLMQLSYEFARLISSLNNLSAETRSSLFVVAGLIIAATYQAVLSPPGGLTSGDSNSNTSAVLISPSPTDFDVGELPAGKVNMGKNLFSLLIIFNTLPFLTSTGLMILLLPKSKFFVIYSMPLVALSLSYGLSAGIISPTGSDLFPMLWRLALGALSIPVVLLKLLFDGRFDQH